MTELHPFLAALAEIGEYEPASRPQSTRNGSAGSLTPPAASDPQAAKYAAVALDREAERLAGTPEGQRNNEANKGAFRMGQLVAHGWLAEDAARDDLIDAAMAAGLSYAEAERTVISGLTAGMSSPRSDVELRTLVPPAFTMTEPALGGGQVFTASHDMGSDDAPQETTPNRPRQLIDGGVFIHGRQAEVPAVWGEGEDVLWAQGEPMILTGPTGVGKTTLGTNIIAGRLGLVPEVLGLPVAAGHRKVLVLAMDRPAQIQRAMARLLRQFPEDVLNERLIVWQGPPPMDIGQHPHVLYKLVEMCDADTVVIDSLKDAAVKLSEEGTGQALSRAMNYCVTNGVEVLAYHHQKKNAARGDGKPNTLADVYGSHWITAGAGSVVLLWGNAGDLVVDLVHLKQPAGEVGPLAIGHDHTAGRSFLYDGMSDRDRLMDLLTSGPQTATAIASWLHEKTDRAAVARVQRRLDRLVDEGTVARHESTEPSAGHRGGRPAYTYSLVRGNSRGIHADQLSVANPQVNPGVGFHAGSHAPDSEVSTGFSRFDTGGHKTAGQEFSRGSHATTRRFARPPLSLEGEGGAPARVREGDSTSLDSRDVEVCSRCHRPAERFIPGANGKRLCPTCAYPTENLTKFDDKED